jgi:hypothetical protein
MQPLAGEKLKKRMFTSPVLVKPGKASSSAASSDQAATRDLARSKEDRREKERDKEDNKV